MDATPVSSDEFLRRLLIAADCHDSLMAAVRARHRDMQQRGLTAHGRDTFYRKPPSALGALLGQFVEQGLSILIAGHKGFTLLQAGIVVALP